MLRKCEFEIEILKVKSDTQIALIVDGPWSYKVQNKLKVTYKHKAETLNNATKYLYCGPWQRGLWQHQKKSLLRTCIKNFLTDSNQ